MDKTITQEPAQSLPRFSVVIPYFKAEATIRRALASVLAQTWGRVEVILIDDKSDDVIAAIVAEYEPKFAATGRTLIFIKSLHNGGPAVARNLGWDRATGDYVAFLDADDEWHPQKLQICAHQMAGHRAPGIFHESCDMTDGGAVGFMSQSRREEDYICRPEPCRSWLIRNSAATPAMVVNRTLSDRFDPAMRYCEDHELWLRITFRHGPFMSMEGPPLTRLSRPSLTPGGHSSRIHQMRLGEIRMYRKFCLSRPSRFVLLPLLISWSVAKHLVLVASRMKQGRGFSPS